MTSSSVTLLPCYLLRLTIDHHQTTTNIITIFIFGIPHKDLLWMVTNNFYHYAGHLRISRRIYRILCNVLYNDICHLVASFVSSQYDITHYISLYKPTFCFSLTLGLPGVIFHLEVTLWRRMSIIPRQTDRQTGPVQTFMEVICSKRSCHARDPHCEIFIWRKIGKVIPPWLIVMKDSYNAHLCN